jgi:hypothetical protein
MILALIPIGKRHIFITLLILPFLFFCPFFGAPPITNEVLITVIDKYFHMILMIQNIFHILIQSMNIIGRHKFINNEIARTPFSTLYSQSCNDICPFKESLHIRQIITKRRFSALESNIVNIKSWPNRISQDNISRNLTHKHGSYPDFGFISCLTSCVGKFQRLILKVSY